MNLKIKEKKKNTNNKAVNNTALKKNTMKTSTIEIVVNQMPKGKEEPKKKTKSKTEKVQEKKKPEKKPKKVKNKKQQGIKKVNSKALKILGIIGLIIIAVIFLFTTPLFNVTEIEVIGNQIVGNEEIISLSQIKLNENMFKNRKSKIKQNIKGNAYIEDVDVKNVLPNKIQLVVQERKPKFMVQLLSNYAYINSQGYILDITKQSKEVPILEGITTPEEEIIVGKRLNNDDLSRLETVLKIISSAEENEISRFIANINVKNVSEYTMNLSEKSVIVHLGNSANIETKMLYVKAILQAEDGTEGEIFVNGDLNNGFQPYFRKKV